MISPSHGPPGTDIDAVLIATGDRWHTPASIMAARAGKDVYSEKPCAMTIDECRELDEAIVRHGRVYQAGTQRRNVDNFRFAADLARSGKLGAIKSVHAGSIKPALGPEPLPGEPLSDLEVIDWDRWLGASPDTLCRGRRLDRGWRQRSNCGQPRRPVWSRQARNRACYQSRPPRP